MDLIIQDLIPQCGGFLLFGKFFLEKKMFMASNLEGISGFAGLSETFLEQSHRMTLHGVPECLPPD